MAMMGRAAICASWLLVLFMADDGTTTASSSSPAVSGGQADPPWAPSYAMNRSTVLYWRNGSGYQPIEDLTQYGMVMFDWAHAAKTWINDYSPMDNGAVLEHQCELLKAAAPDVKCIVCE